MTGEVVTVEPLAGFTVLRDLVVDIDVLFAKIKQVEAHLIELSKNEEMAREHRQSRDDLALIDSYSPCMLAVFAMQHVLNFWRTLTMWDRQLLLRHIDSMKIVAIAAQESASRSSPRKMVCSVVPQTRDALVRVRKA